MDVRRDKLRFFRSGEHFRKWLDRNHSRSGEIWMGFYKKASGKGGITYAHALDEALCYGWIDGIRKSLDEDSFTIRFTPRKPKSIWSNVNIRHVARLKKEGRMKPTGIAAFSAKDDSRAGVYSFERTIAELEPSMIRQFRKNAEAWKYYQSQPPYYRRITAWWVISAKREETRHKRLAKLMEHSSRHERVPQLTSAPRKTAS